MVNVSQYQITLDRPNGVYVPGENVVGMLHLRAGENITCRGVRLKLTGKGYVHWHTGSGDDRTDYHGRKEYVSKSMTVLGNFHRTTCISEAGANAFFDENVGGGEMIIPLNEAKVNDDFVLAVRSMDYDWGKKDDLLGETLVRVAQDLLMIPGKRVSFPLKRGGQKVTDKQGNGSEVTLSAWVDQIQGKHMLRLTCHQTTGLRSGDWFSKNDVYVQCYPVHKDTDGDAPLPQPVKNYIVPANQQISIPFSIKLPSKYLPSSFSTWHGDACYVNYSLYSNIDIALWRDPSIRRYITVVSTELPSPTQLAPMLKTNMEPQTIYGCDCCGLTCCEKGEAFFRAAVDKTYLAPGDTVFVTAFAKNDTEDACAFTVCLRQEATMQSNGGASRRISIEHKLLEDVVQPGGTLDWSTPRMGVIPPVPPNFQSGRATTSQGQFRRDPLTWWYLLSVTMDMPGFFTTDIVWNVPVTVGAFSVHSLKQMDPAKYGGTLEAVQGAGIGENDLPPPIEDVDYPPPTFEPTDLVNSAVPVDSTNLKHAEDELLENKYNVGGNPPPFAPSYPVPEVKCTAHPNLPNCSK